MDVIANNIYIHICPWSSKVLDLTIYILHIVTLTSFDPLVKTILANNMPEFYTALLYFPSGFTIPGAALITLKFRWQNITTYNQDKGLSSFGQYIDVLHTHTDSLQ